MSKKIGFIGIGLMGLPMAKNILKAGYNLKAFNRSQKKSEALKEHGAEISTSIDDVVNSFIRSIEYDGSGIFNIASGVSLSIEELAMILLEESGNLGCNIKSKSSQEIFSKLVIDIRKAQDQLNWSPEINIRQGIGNLLNDEFKE